MIVLRDEDGHAPFVSGVGDPPVHLETLGDGIREGAFEDRAREIELRCLEFKPHKKTPPSGSVECWSKEDIRRVA